MGAFKYVLWWFKGKRECTKKGFVVVGPQRLGGLDSMAVKGGIPNENTAQANVEKYGNYHFLSKDFLHSCYWHLVYSVVKDT